MTAMNRSKSQTRHKTRGSSLTRPGVPVSRTLAPPPSQSALGPLHSSGWEHLSGGFYAPPPPRPTPVPIGEAALEEIADEAMHHMGLGEVDEWDWGVDEDGLEYEDDEEDYGYDNPFEEYGGPPVSAEARADDRWASHEDRPVEGSFTRGAKIGAGATLGVLTIATLFALVTGAGRR